VPFPRSCPLTSTHAGQRPRESHPDSDTDTEAVDTLPFAHGFFDAIVSLDAYHYFGTDDLYLAHLAPYVRPGGPIGIVVPGLVGELADGVPEALAPYWEWDFCSFHSPGWWRAHWQKTGLVTVETADMVADGWRHWLIWQDISCEQGYTEDRDEATMLRIDEGQTLGFTRVVARTKPSRGE